METQGSYSHFMMVSIFAVPYFIYAFDMKHLQKYLLGTKFLETYKFLIIGQKCIVYKEQNCIVLQKKYVQNKDTKI